MNIEAIEIDKLRVRDIIERYFNAPDFVNSEALSRCFSVDAQVEYFCSTPVRRIAGNRAITEGLVKPIGSFTATNHSVSNFITEVDGNRPRVALPGSPAAQCTRAMAHHTPGAYAAMANRCQGNERMRVLSKGPELPGAEVAVALQLVARLTNDVRLA